MSTNMAIRPVELLLVEDSEVDVMLTREALLEAKVINNLHVVENGDDAMAFLRQEPPFEHAVRPDLVFLDLNLPRRSGHEILGEMKADPDLKKLPVVILTTSSAVEDVRAAYTNQAHSFICKPADFESLANIVAKLDNFWFCMVALQDTQISATSTSSPAPTIDYPEQQ